MGIDVGELNRCSNLLKDFVAIDLRGGIFNQLDMYKAVYNLADKPEHKNCFGAWALDKHQVVRFEDAVKLAAYIMRVTYPAFRGPCSVEDPRGPHISCSPFFVDPVVRGPCFSWNPFVVYPRR